MVSGIAHDQQGRMMSRSNLIWILLVLQNIVIAFAFTEAAFSKDGAQDAHTLRDQILGGIHRNYSKVGAAHGKVAFRREFSPKVHDELVADINEQRKTAGFQLSPMEEQLATRKISFWVKNNSLRCEGTWISSETIVTVKDGLVKDFLPAIGQNMARLRITDISEGLCSCHDPREVLYDPGMRIEHLLLNAKLLRTATSSEPEDHNVSILEFVDADQGNWQLMCDPHRDYLPVQYVYSGDDGTISGEIEYRPVPTENDQAWFPNLIVVKRWPMEEEISLADIGTQKGTWMSRETYELIGLKLDPHLADEQFDIHPPDGTYVVDSRLQNSYIVGKEDQK